MDTEKRTPGLRKRCMNEQSAGLEWMNPLLESTRFWERGIFLGNLVVKHVK